MSQLLIDRLQVLTLPHFTDLRGSFTKTFHEDTLQAAGIEFTLRESYYSVSGKDVIRGMHFQTPPAQHAKIVFCPVGKILDVVLDLRKHSSTYGQHFSQVLSAENHLALYIPEGCAHGFRALTEGAMTFYLVSSVHSPAHDSGIRWDSFGFDWGAETPVMSERDQTFPEWTDFNSPF
ncbi:MAG: dTDP-4-keto-6-deoxy-D-glucose epimerase [Sphingobacteriales bacterium]|nr:MAG: dTDP-4-keto-6-deoxy-D-glucose epimerase [Sphingobacteriales bacterium]